MLEQGNWEVVHIMSQTREAAWGQYTIYDHVVKLGLGSQALQVLEQTDYKTKEQTKYATIR